MSFVSDPKLWHTHKIITWMGWFMSILTKVAIWPLLTGVLLAGCANQSIQTTPDLNKIKPVTHTLKQQVTIKRLSDLLSDPAFNQIDRAEIYFQRGVLYDAIGLSHLAYFDWLYALELKPDLADAYNMIGIYYLRQQEFSRSYESFDSVIELDSSHQFAYFNRAIALYYGGRAKLAEMDFESFYQFDQTDGFRVLWWYFAKQSYDPQAAKKQLATQTKALDTNSWSAQIVRYIQGELSEAELLNQAEQYAAEGTQSINQNLCEAYFYIGKKLKLKGQKQAAKTYFKAVLSTQVYEFIEYRYAQLELEMLTVDVDKS